MSLNQSVLAMQILDKIRRQNSVNLPADVGSAE